MHPAAAAWRQDFDTNDRNRVENARPSGFFRAALRSLAGMLSFLEYLALPASRHPVISDVDGRGTKRHQSERVPIHLHRRFASAAR
jgi:hypothetical protein